MKNGKDFRLGIADIVNMDIQSLQTFYLASFYKYQLLK